MKHRIKERLREAKEFWSRRDVEEKIIIAMAWLLLVLFVLVTLYAVLDSLCSARCVREGYPRHNFLIPDGCYCCKRVNNTDIVIRLEDIE